MQTAVRLKQVLDLVADRGVISFQEMREALGWSKSTVHRLASGLSQLGLLRPTTNGSHYRLGIQLYLLGLRVDAVSELRLHAMKVLQELAARTNEIVNLAMPDGAEMVFIDRIDAPQTLQPLLRIGSRLPMISCAVGKAYLAHLSVREQGRTLKTVIPPPHSDSAPTDRQQLAQELAQELAQIRKQGYAINDSDSEGIRSAAAPVFGSGQHPIAAISVAGPNLRIRREQLPELGMDVSAAAARISHSLRYQATTLPDPDEHQEGGH